MTTFPNTSKFAKYTPLGVVYMSSFLLGVWKCGETWSFVFGLLLQYIPATQNMMSEMQTRLKHLFDTAIMMTSSRTIACKIWTKNTARKSTSENS